VLAQGGGFDGHRGFGDHALVARAVFARDDQGPRDAGVVHELRLDLTRLDAVAESSQESSALRSQSLSCFSAS
jgi:hypothetical protein